MSNRWYRKNERNSNPHCLTFTYRNAAYFPLIRQIEVHHYTSTNEFRISVFSPNDISQKKIVKCYEKILGEDFKKIIHIFEVCERSVNTEYIAANSYLFEKLFSVFTYINKNYPESIDVKIIQELRNLIHHSFNNVFISEIAVWQDVPAYINPLLKSASHLATLTLSHCLFPKTINPAPYLFWLKEGENPNQKNIVGSTLLFMLSEKYRSFKKNGLEKAAYKIIQILIFYGADIFYSENAESLTPAEKLDEDGFPEVFRGIIMSNIRVEKSLHIKSIKQSFSDNSITTEFTFHDAKKNDIVTALLPVRKLNQNKSLLNTLYELFTQTFESPDGSMDKVKKEFYCAFTSDKNEKIFVDVLYDRNKSNHDNKIVIGFVIYKILDALLNIEFAVVNEKYRIGVMKILVFRIGFCLGLLNPDLPAGVFFAAEHANSWNLAATAFVYPKYNVLGAEDVIKKMLGKNSNIKIVGHVNNVIKEEPVKVKGGYPAATLQQKLFYEIFMGFKVDPVKADRLIPPPYAVSALTYLRMTDEFLNELQTFSKIHGVDFYNNVILPLAELLPSMDPSLGQFKPITLQSYSFPKAYSLFAPFKKINDSMESPLQIPQIRARL